MADLLSGSTPSTFLKDAKLRGCGVVSPRRLLIEQVRETVKRVGGGEVSVEDLQPTLTEWIGEEE